MLGIFDSGLGGLTVLKEVVNALPHEKFIYYGDTAHLPYGNRSDLDILRLTDEALDFLFEKGCDFVLIACNSASARALPKLKLKYPDKIFGVIDPVVEYFAQSDFKRIGVIGTRATINSDLYKKEIQKNAPDKLVFSKATPLLVPLVEENWARKNETKKILRTYLKMLKLNKVDSLILGCTHYPILLRPIQQVMGKLCFVPNPADLVAGWLAGQALSQKKQLVKFIQSKESNPTISLEAGQTIKQKIEFYVTDLTPNFQSLASLIIGHSIILTKL